MIIKLYYIADSSMSTWLCTLTVLKSTYNCASAEMANLYATLDYILGSLWSCMCYVCDDSEVNLKESQVAKTIIYYLLHGAFFK